jgi:hypothetical protein
MKARGTVRRGAAAKQKQRKGRAMSDPYSVGNGDTMPPSDANAAGRGARGPVFRGMRRSRTNPQTGQREVQVWLQGQGYMPENSLAPLPEEDRSYFERGRSALSAARRNSQLARQFTEANRTERPNVLGVPAWFDSGGETGGTAGLPVPDFMQNPTRQRMEGLSNQMVRANIQPGQAGTMNSIFEQILARQQYPTTGTYGPVNAERTIGILTDEAEMLAALEAAERWAQERRTLQGFEVDWTRNHSERVRREAEQRYRSEFAQRYPAPGAQSQGGQQRRRWNPETGRIE